MFAKLHFWIQFRGSRVETQGLSATFFATLLWSCGSQSSTTVSASASWRFAACSFRTSGDGSEAPNVSGTGRAQCACWSIGMVWCEVAAGFAMGRLPADVLSHCQSALYLVQRWWRAQGKWPTRKSEHDVIRRLGVVFGHGCFLLESSAFWADAEYGTIREIEGPASGGARRWEVQPSPLRYWYCQRTDHAPREEGDARQHISMRRLEHEKSFDAATAAAFGVHDATALVSGLRCGRCFDLIGTAVERGSGGVELWLSRRPLSPEDERIHLESTRDSLWSLASESS